MSRASYAVIVIAISYLPSSDQSAALARLTLEADAARLLRSVLSKPGY